MKLIFLKNYLKKVLSEPQIKFLGRFKNLLGFFSRNDLTRLAIIFGSDKWGNHNYTPYYEDHFKSYKRKRIKLLEIGVGGNESKIHGGASLRMWKSYFRKGDINGIDIHDKSALQEKRIKIFQGDQSDKVFLNKLGNETGPFDIIIDDGSHLNEHIIISFNTLFPYLTKPNTAMNFFKSLTDGINHTEYQVDNYQPNYLDKHITSLHFYHNLVFIFKGNSISKIKL